jgi:hypothetical protein
MPAKLKLKLSDFGKEDSPRKALTCMDKKNRVCKVRYGDDTATFKVSCSARDLLFCNAVKTEGLKVGDDLYAIDAEAGTKGPSGAVVAMIRHYPHLAFSTPLESAPLVSMEWVCERPDLCTESDDDCPEYVRPAGFTGVTGCLTCL